MPILGITASSMQSAVPAFDSIQTFNITSTTASITFSSIPSTYKHLQIRGIVVNIANAGPILMRANGDTASNYTEHYIYGNPPTIAAGGAGAKTSLNIGGISYGLSFTNPRACIIDILDYNDTNKFKTIKLLTGEDENGSGEMCFQSGMWRNTNAITSLTITPNNDFKTGSHFALYGIK